MFLLALHLLILPVPTYQRVAPVGQFLATWEAGHCCGGHIPIWSVSSPMALGDLTLGTSGWGMYGVSHFWALRKEAG